MLRKARARVATVCPAGRRWHGEACDGDKLQTRIMCCVAVLSVDNNSHVRIENQVATGNYARIVSPGLCVIRLATRAGGNGT